MTTTRTAKPAPAIAVDGDTITIGTGDDAYSVAVPTIADLRDAVAAVSVAGSASNGATATLAALTLSRYVMHAAKYAGTLDGVTVLPESYRRDVAALVWLDATGRVTPPTTKDRTPGETSIGQYVARFGTVATHADYGFDWMETPTIVGEAYTAISADKSDATAAKQDRDFTVWLSGLLPDDSAAITRALALMGPGGAGHDHRAAFIRAIQPAK